MPECKQELRNIVTSEEVQPCPKAAPRKNSNRERKAGRSIIATDSHEKQAIREQKEKKNVKKQRAREKVKKCKTLARNLPNMLKSKPGNKRDLSTGKTQKNSKLKRQKMLERSSSESEGEAPFPIVSTNDDKSADEECIYCQRS